MTHDELKSWVKEITSRRFHNLSVSLEYDENPNDVYPMLLYVPDIESHDHEHIELDREQAIILRDWLSAYLEITS